MGAKDESEGGKNLNIMSFICNTVVFYQILTHAFILTTLGGHKDIVE